jgi:uncharacterized membrane protein YuzA (DUF378 family)
MMCSKLSALALFVCAIGAINWGLIGAVNFNLVFWLAELVKLPILERIVYIIVGLAGVYGLFDSISCTFAQK